MSQDPSSTLLVTGGSGRLGRRVLELLLAHGDHAIIATTRRPDTLAGFPDDRVEVRQADFEQAPSQLATAFRGADRMLLISTDAVDRPGRRFEQASRAVEAAALGGVRHIVYTSLAHPVEDSPVLIARDHAKTEQALAASGVGYTALRNNLYTDFLPMNLSAAIASGRLVAAAGDGRAAYVTREDCAQAAAAALRSDFDGTRYFEITGPAAVSYAELAALASELSGTDVAFVPVDTDALIAAMIGSGLPEPVARLMASFDAGMQGGYFAPVTSAVQELTGRPPMSVRSFLESHRDALERRSVTP
ncbi:MAG: SDR family oxidoreductase [Gemmatimonadaceae bacterium]|nr:SDR family oxidoreductase [Gemmatimonadaceae bacterium]